jgi:hypothetical protein
MDQISDFVDERQKSWCVHCRAWLNGSETNRDHVPSKSLLLKPFPPNLPVVDICKACNTSFSKDEQYLIAFIGCVLSGSTEPERQQNPTTMDILNHSPMLRARIEGAKTEFRTLGGDTRLMWKPETQRVHRVVVKNARGHAFFEYGEPMLEEPTSVWSAPLETLSMAERSTFEHADTAILWPEVGSRMMTRVMTGQDLTGSWVIVQDGVYRYAVAQHGGMRVKSVMFEYLATEVCWGD